jgi:hypothetical protein
MFFRVFSVSCNGFWEEFQFLRHMLSRKTPSLPTWCKCGTTLCNMFIHFFRFSSATGRPFFCLMIFRTVASLSSSQGGEGKSDPRQDGSRRNVRGGWTRFAAMGRQRCQAAIAVLCGVVLLNLWGHCVDSGLYGYIHIFLYTIYVHYIYLHIYIYILYIFYVCSICFPEFPRAE